MSSPLLDGSIHYILTPPSAALIEVTAMLICDGAELDLISTGSLNYPQPQKFLALTLNWYRRLGTIPLVAMKLFAV